MRRVVALLAGWLAVALGVLLLTGTLRGEDRPLDDETRILAYPLDAPLRFAIEGSSDEVKLVTWLVGPARWARDPRATSLYALRLRLFDEEGRLVHEGPFWVRARGGQTEREDGRVVASARLPDQRAWISDDRLTRVDLRGDLPRGGVMEVEAIYTPPGHRVLLIAYQRTERSDADRIRVTRGQSDAFREGRARRISSLDWEALPTRWQDNVARHRWDRLGALPRGDGLVPTEQLYTSFAKGSWWEEAARGLPLVPGAALAFNLEGPTTLSLRWRGLDGGPAGPQPTQLALRHADGRAELRELGEVGEIGPIDVPEGVVSVHVALSPRAKGPAVLQARTLRGGLDRAWGDPPRAPVDEARQQDVGPDLRNLEVYRALPPAQGPPLRFAVHEGEWVWLRAFTRLPPALPGLRDPLPPTEAAGPALEVRALDAEGRELARWSTRASHVPSVFERYTQVDAPDRAAVSEPRDLTLRPPDGAAWLEVTAEAPVDLGLRTSLDPDEPVVIWPGYEAEHDRRVDGRWVPKIRDPWAARAPEDLDALIRAGRDPRVDVQVRLDLRAPAASGGDGDGDFAGLLLGEPFDLIAEPDHDGHPSLGARARITEAGLRLAVPASGRVQVDYRVQAEALGLPPALTVDGQPLEQPLRSAAGTLTLDGLAPGGITLQASGPGLFLARAIAEPLWEVRRVVRVAPGQTLRVPLPGAAGRLHLHAYGPEGGQLRWEVLGEPTPGLYASDQRSAWRGSQALLASGGGAWPLSFAGPALTSLSTTRIRLGEDLPAEGATLLLTLEDAPGPILLRATATWAEEDNPSDSARTLRSGP